MAKLTLRELIGTFTSELIAAEAYTAQASMHFLRTVGFKGGRRGSDEWGEVRFVRFSYPGKDGDGQDVRRFIRVPLLTLLPVPLQQVAEAEYELFVAVKDVVASNAGPLGGEEGGALGLRVADVIAEVAPYVTERESVAKMPRVRVKLTMKQSDLPAGLATCLSKLAATVGEGN